MGITLDWDESISDIKVYIKNNRGVIVPLNEGDYFKEDKCRKSIIYQMKLDVALNGEIEILGNHIELNKGEVNRCGWLDFSCFRQCDYLNQKTSHLLKGYTLVSPKELIRFGLATNSIDFIFGE